MKTKSFILTIVIFVSGLYAKAQDCSFYYPMKEQAELGYTNYDKKEKVSGKSTQKVTNITKNSGSVSAEVLVKTYDKKDQLLAESSMDVKCEKGVFYVSMERFLSPESMEAYKNMEIEIESEDLIIPASLKVGDMLPDGKVKMKVKNNSISIMDMTVTVSNRKIEAEEKVTTPAGTFDCLKISYDITTAMMITIKAKATEWICKDVGMVKSESYNKNGSLMGSTVLTELKD